MRDVHISEELLRGLAELEFPPELLLRLGWEHLQALCPECAAGIQKFLASGRQGVYDLAFEKAEKAVQENDSEAAEQKRIADREVTELLRLDPVKALRRIRTARKRFRSSLHVERLVAEARKELHRDPRRSVEILAFARAITERPSEPLEADLQLRTRLQYGNALRVAGKFQDAEQVFKAARDEIKGNPMVAHDLYALAARFEGTLRTNQRRYKEARILLARAILIYRVFGEEREAAQALLKIAFVYFQLDELPRSFEAIQEALSVLDSDEDLSLVAIARQVLASYLCDSGDAEAARQSVAQSTEIFDRYVQEAQAESFRLLVVWLRGRIARNLGEYERAEGLLSEAAEGYSDIENSFDTALVLLDLADSYLMAGDGESVRRLVPEIEPLLAANDLDQEVIAALLLFQNSISQDLVSSATVAMVRKKIQKIGPTKSH